MLTVKALVREEIANHIGRGLGKVAGAEDSRFSELAADINKLQTDVKSLSSAFTAFDAKGLEKQNAEILQLFERAAVQIEGVAGRVAALTDRVVVIENLLHV